MSFLENVVGVQLFKRRNLFYKIGRDLLKGQIGVYHNFSFEKGPLWEFGKSSFKLVVRTFENSNFSNNFALPHKKDTTLGVWNQYKSALENRLYLILVLVA